MNQCTPRRKVALTKSEEHCDTRNYLRRLIPPPTFFLSVAMCFFSPEAFCFAVRLFFFRMDFCATMAIGFFRSFSRFVLPPARGFFVLSSRPSGWIFAPPWPSASSAASLGLYCRPRGASSSYHPGLPDGFLRHHGHRLLPQLLSVCTAARAGLLRLIIPALAAGHDLLEARGLALSLPGELEEIGVDHVP